MKRKKNKKKKKSSGLDLNSILLSTSPFNSVIIESSIDNKYVILCKEWQSQISPKRVTFTVEYSLLLWQTFGIVYTHTLGAYDEEDNLFFFVFFFFKHICYVGE